MNIIFDGSKNKNTQGTNSDFIKLFLQGKQKFWNDWREITKKPVTLFAVLNDMGFDFTDKNLNMADIHRHCWTADSEKPIDFGLDAPINRNAWDGATTLVVLNFNCDAEIQTDICPSAELAMEKKESGSCVIKPRCYFWKQWKYHVSIDQITLPGWIQWCNELFQLQHGKPRPKNNHVFVNNDMTEATVKARVWNKARIEKWLKDKGYNYTVTCEMKYQFPFEKENDVILVDADLMPEKKHA